VLLPISLLEKQRPLVLNMSDAVLTSPSPSELWKTCVLITAVFYLSQELKGVSQAQFVFFPDILRAMLLL